jgi:hypothetical protein
LRPLLYGCNNAAFQGGFCAWMGHMIETYETAT